jgi:ATP/maltotriose-dependent transcriptional regulator MalT
MIRWIRSRFCSGGDCVEVAFTPTGVRLRDSKNPHRAPLAFTVQEWRAFIAGAAGGQFNPDKAIVRLSAVDGRLHQVLTGIARGLSNAEIAAELHITDDTVKTHVHRLLKRLEVPTRAAAVQRGWELGLLGHTTEPTAPRRTA